MNSRPRQQLDKPATLCYMQRASKLSPQLSVCAALDLRIDIWPSQHGRGWKCGMVPCQ